MCACALAQSATEGGAFASQRFARDGLAFEYPAGWTLEDLSDANAQHLLLTRVTGTVGVKVLVDERGDVVSAKAISGHRLLWGSSERAIRKWKFSPTKLCGRPVRTVGIALITYTIRF